MKVNLKHYIIWLTPLIVSLLIQGFSFGWNRVVLGNALENFCALLILVSISLLFKPWLGRIFQYVFFVFWSLSCLIETIYYFIFKANLSASSIYVLLETNLAESNEFIEFYLNPAILIMIIGYLFFIVLFFLWRPILVVYGSTFKRRIPPVLIIIFSVFFLFQTGFIQYNFAYLTLKSITEYIEEYKKIESFNIDRPKVDIEGFRFNDSIKRATYVFILGESTTRNRLSIYGYSRNTTPYLQSIKSDLLIYDNVISPNAFTIGSLEKVLTLNGLSSENDFSIIQLMNQAGFKTFWLSNQRPIGEYESLVTKIASASDTYQIKNTALDGSITPYDEVLIPLLEEALEDEAPLKFIVLHPLGTHMKYSDRYPDSFNKFKGQSFSNFNHSRAHELSNAYDNSIVYHDYFLKKVHQKLISLEEPSYLLYLSDHGEEVFTEIDFAGHIDDNPTKSMYEIPFFLWMNPEFEKVKSIGFNLSRPYTIKHFMHSFSDLNGIRFKTFNPEKSIFSKDYKTPKRIIGDKLDFDTYFKN
ncbi:sulfatase-like hydrolase/transferase [Psychroflexus sp. CAK57W]|uniref:sulfatase-like hydrolase/transferase n=1 Tax=Psychroflexus curvus TaxID=2873595 RepID=UPI001CD02A35|nr:sulfatase-like hydrolase/transferase [Psychroflexus curvus]MBZ9786318.1 sulfatase-like hydrolase/transferase [Psychroflexus curvus]